MDSKKKGILLNIAFFTSIVGLISGIGAFIWYGVYSSQRDENWKSISQNEFVSKYNSLVKDNEVVTKTNVLRIYNTIIGSSTTLSDLELEKIINMIETETTTGRLSTTNLENEYTMQNNFDALIKNGRLSELSLNNDFVQKNEFDPIYDTIFGGRLSKNNLDLSYAQNVNLQTLNGIVNNGRLSQASLTNKYLSLNYLNSWSPNDFTIQNNVLVRNDLVVEGETLLKGDLKVNKETTFLDDVFVGDEGNAQASPPIPENTSGLVVTGKSTLDQSVNINGDLTIGVVNGSPADLSVVGKSDLLGDVTIGEAYSPANLFVETPSTLNGDLSLNGYSTLGSLGLDSVLNTKGQSDDTTTTFLGKLDLSEANVLGYPHPTYIEHLSSFTENANGYNVNPSFSYTHSKKLRLTYPWDEGQIYMLLTLNIDSTTKYYGYSRGSFTQSFLISSSAINSVTSTTPFTKTFIFPYLIYDGNITPVISLLGSSSYTVDRNVGEGIGIIRTEIQVKIFVENGLKYIRLYAPSDPTFGTAFYIGSNTQVTYQGSVRIKHVSNAKKLTASLMLFRA